MESQPITYQGANPISAALAWQALALIHGSLERVALDGDDRNSVGLLQSFSDGRLSRSDVIVENTLLQERRLATNPREVTEDLRDVLLEVEWRE